METMMDPYLPSRLVHYIMSLFNLLILQFILLWHPFTILNHSITVLLLDLLCHQLSQLQDQPSITMELEHLQWYMTFTILQSLIILSLLYLFITVLFTQLNPITSDITASIKRFTILDMLNTMLTIKHIIP